MNAAVHTSTSVHRWLGVRGAKSRAVSMPSNISEDARRDPAPHASHSLSLRRCIDGGQRRSPDEDPFAELRAHLYGASDRFTSAPLNDPAFTRLVALPVLAEDRDCRG